MPVDYLVSLFSSDVLITFGKDKFTFETKKKSIELDTRVYLDIKKDLMVAVGDYNEKDTDIKQIDLFETSEFEISKIDLLMQYIRYAFEILHNRKFLIKPRKVIIQNLKDAEEIFVGFESFIFTSAVLNAGGIEIYADSIKFSSLDEWKNYLKEKKKW